MSCICPDEDDARDRCLICGQWMEWEVEFEGDTQQRIMFWCDNCGFTDYEDHEM